MTILATVAIAAATLAGGCQGWSLVDNLQTMIETGKNEACLEHYVKMVETLEEIYF